MTLRWPHAALGSVLGLGGIGLIVGAVWIAGIPTLACTEGMSVNGWIYAGFILFALGLPAFVIWGTLQLHEGLHGYRHRRGSYRARARALSRQQVRALPVRLT